MRRPERGAARGWALAALVLVAGCGDATQPSAPPGGAAEAATQPARANATVPDSVPEALRAAWSAAHGGSFGEAARWAASADGTYVVLWEPIGGPIPEAEPFSVAIGVARADGAPMGDAAKVLFDAEMPHHGHGMNLVPSIERRVQAGGPGASFVASGVLLHMSGKWVVAVDIEENGVLERAQWHVDIE